MLLVIIPAPVPYLAVEKAAYPFPITLLPIFFLSTMKSSLNTQPAATTLPTALKTRPAARIGDGSRTSRRGFASMDPAEQRRIASEGGKASHASGQGHKWTTAEAREAGRKGGLTSRRGPSRATTEAAAKAKGKATK